MTDKETPILSLSIIFLGREIIQSEEYDRVLSFLVLWPPGADQVIQQCKVARVP